MAIVYGYDPFTGAALSAPEPWPHMATVYFPTPPRPVDEQAAMQIAHAIDREAGRVYEARTGQAAWRRRVDPAWMGTE